MFTLDGCIDAYATEFQAVVKDIHHSWLILDETSFRPDTAARESDIGIIDDIPVSRVVEGHDGSILHLLDDLGAAHSIEVGQAVYGKVDWSHRFAMMRLHTAQHLAYLGFEAILGPTRRRGRRVAPTYSFVEVESAEPTAHQAAKPVIAAWMARVIDDDLLISMLSRPMEPNRQYWHVDGVGTLACSGLHPLTTAEVGDIDLVMNEAADGLVRMTTRLVSE